MAWQEHNSFDILPQEDKAFLEDLARTYLRVSGVQRGHFLSVHHEGRSEVFIATVDVKRT